VLGSTKQLGEQLTAGMAEESGGLQARSSIATRTRLAEVFRRQPLPLVEEAVPVQEPRDIVDHVLGL